ncbi:MAG TPA: hypothetical protein VFE24_04410, partial [Pirellulales bacterium]|nr:hypothetical protein [Pirellulales bacterium]
MPATPEQLAAALEAFRLAAEANRQTATRRGNVIELSAASADDVLISADLHGQRGNFEAILARADLSAHPRRHLILQEVCHGGPCYEDGIACQSHLLLTEVARLKTKYPAQ